MSRSRSQLKKNGAGTGKLRTGSSHTDNRTPNSFPSSGTCERCPGLESIAEHLPECDPEGPDIAGAGELEEVDALGGAPGNRQLEVDVEVGLVVVLAHAQGSRQTKVRHFHRVLGEDWRKREKGGGWSSMRMDPN